MAKPDARPATSCGTAQCGLLEPWPRRSQTFSMESDNAPEVGRPPVRPRALLRSRRRFGPKMGKLVLPATNKRPGPILTRRPRRIIGSRRGPLCKGAFTPEFVQSSWLPCSTINERIGAIVPACRAGKCAVSWKREKPSLRSCQYWLCCRRQSAIPENCHCSTVRWGWLLCWRLLAFPGVLDNVRTPVNSWK